jgi:lysophospholipase L1-like esterase
LIRPGAPIPSGVVLVDKPLTPIEAAYIPAIKTLCDRNGATLALMNEPFANHEDPDTIELPRQLLALGVPIIVETRNRMFGKAHEETINRYYSDYFHFNSNGAREATQAYEPVIESILAEKRAD